METSYDFDLAADYIDLGALTARYDELKDHYDEHDDDDRAEWEDLTAVLDVLASDLGTGDIDGLRDYAYDEPTLIRDSYFVTYAQELADDLGAIPDDLGWPARHIDWDAAAEELKADYSSVTIQGTEYFIRAC